MFRTRSQAFKTNLEITTKAGYFNTPNATEKFS